MILAVCRNRRFRHGMRQRGRRGKLQGALIGLQHVKRGRQIVLVNRPALRPQIKAVVRKLHEQNLLRPPRQLPVEQQHRRFHARIWLEHARRKADHRPEKSAVNQHVPQRFIGVLRLKDNPFRHDDARPSVRRKVFRDVIHEQHFRAFGLNRKAVVRANAPFRRHKGRIGENHVERLAPMRVAGQRVVFENLRIGETVQIEIDERQAHHVRRNVVAGDVREQLLPLRRRQQPAHHHSPLLGGGGVSRRIIPQNFFIRGNQKARRAARRVEDAIMLLRRDNLHDEVNDVARRAELPRVPLRIHD